MMLERSHCLAHPRLQVSRRTGLCERCRTSLLGAVRKFRLNMELTERQLFVLVTVNPDAVRERFPDIDEAVAVAQALLSEKEAV